MKRSIIGFISLIVFIAFLSSGMFARFMEFMTWLLLLQYTGPETSLPGEIIVRVLTFLTSYGLVGCVFDAFGWYDKGLMKAFYWILSTVLGFLLAWVVWLFETYLLIVGIIFGVVLIGVIAYFVLSKLVSKSRTTVPTEQKQE